MPKPDVTKYFRQSARWLPMLFFWMFQVALTSTASSSRGHEISRHESLQKSIIAWTVWALLAPLIVTIDKRLPLAGDAIFRRLFVHIPLSLFFTALNLYADAVSTAFMNSGIHHLPGPVPIISESLAGSFQSRFVVYWMVLFVYLIFDYSSHLKERGIRTAELERLVSEARLEAFRARLHPHFLFNALNTISAYIESEPRTARHMLEQLGELLRLSLTHADDPELPLAQELAFIERYLELQKTRFDERLTTIVTVDPEVLDAVVPTFILQPLVENAIRYSTATRSGRSLVEVKAWESNGVLRLSVRDDGPGMPAGWDPERHVGIGISNTRERLRGMFAEGQQTFEIHSNPGEGVRVELSFPFRNSCNPGSALVTN